MIASYQNSPNPTRGLKNVNFSMPPPEKLPDWLLEKKNPSRITNYSMQPPNASDRGGVLAPIDVINSNIASTKGHEDVIDKHFFPPYAISNTSPIRLNNNMDSEVLTVNKEKEEYSLLENNLGSDDTMLNPVVFDGEDANKDNVIDTAQHTFINQKSESSVHPTSQNQISLTDSFSTGQTERAVSRQYSNTKSLGNWLYSNNNFTMVLVVGAIIFSIVLIILLAIGII